MFVCMCNFKDVSKHACTFLERSCSARSAGEKATKSLIIAQPWELWFQLKSADSFHHKRIPISAVITDSSTEQMWNSQCIPTFSESDFSGRDLAGLTLNIFDMSSELRCWATSHSLAVMSIRLQISMSTRLAFSWILVSRSDICYMGMENYFRMTLAI